MIKRPLLYIQRNLIRSGLLFLFIFLVGVCLSMSLNLSKTGVVMNAAIRKTLGAKVAVQLDQSKLVNLSKQEISEIVPLSTEWIKKMSASNEVKYVDYSLIRYALADKSYMITKSDIGNTKTNRLVLTGVNYAAMSIVENGSYTLNEGRVFTSEEIKAGSGVTIINQSFADFNQLKIGDMIRVYNNYFGTESYIGQTEIITSDKNPDQELKIIGIIKKNPSIDFESSPDEVYNLYVPDELVAQEHQFFTTTFPTEKDYMFKQISPEPIFTVNDPENIDSLITKLKNEKIDANFILIRSDENYKSVLGPLTNLVSVSTILQYGSIIAFPLLIGSLVVIYLLERRKEFALLLSLGEKKSKILSQICIECLIIGLVSLIAAYITGTIISKSYFESIVKTQANQNINTVVEEGSLKIAQEELRNTKIDSFDPVAMCIYFTSTVTMLSLAAVIPTSIILRKNPKKNLN